MKMKNNRHFNISFFIPHLGCPYHCSFCNQNKISGTISPPSLEEVEKTLLKEYNNSDLSKRKNTEIAFFGGSFTAIDKNLMESYLKLGYKFIKDYGFYGIRISTRPDCIDENILTLLKKYGVTSIELGVQSMEDEVLTKNFRGHSKKDVIYSSKLIKKFGFELGHQMMVGLYSQGQESVFKTAKEIAKLKPKTVRIYPVLVIKGTHLEKLYNNNEFSPLNVDEAASITKSLLLFFEKKKINVIRVGLHSEKSLVDSLVSGPYHPAFGEIVESKIYFDLLLKLLKSKKQGQYTFCINKSEYSKGIGHKKENIAKLKELGYMVKLKGDEKLKKHKIKFKK